MSTVYLSSRRSRRSSRWLRQLRRRRRVWQQVLARPYTLEWAMQLFAEQARGGTIRVLHLPDDGMLLETASGRQWLFDDGAWQEWSGPPLELEGEWD